jgi:hypothetical protein
MKQRLVEREIARDVTIDKDWIEFTPKSPMKISRRFQSVTLGVNDARYNTESDDMYLADGTNIMPEVQISDLEGNWYHLKSGGYTARDFDHETSTFRVGTASFRARDPELPSDGEFKTIRIRSATPFTCKTVVWRNYDLK